MRIGTYLAAICCSLLAVAGVWAGDVSLDASAWKQDGFVTARYRIEGTASRNNPLRLKLEQPFRGAELFVRFRLRYVAESIDSPTEGNGEFIVLWLDEQEGNAGSTHSSGVPNLGLHVSGEENRFMARYRSGGERFSRELIGDREFLVVGRLWKSKPGPESAFDQLSLWVDPQEDAEFAPDASVSSSKAIGTVSWIGFSTGNKTEITDEIDVWDVQIAETWRAILGLPPETHEPSSGPPPEAERSVAFEDDVLPVLQSRCFECHAGDDAEAGVRLDVLDEVLQQVSPGNAGQSRLIELVSMGEMPPDAEVGKDELAVLRAWIDEGLQWDERLLPTPIPQTDHWAFQPIVRPAIPVVDNRDWTRTPIDAFIARKHEALGIVPAAEADAETLNRRISLDMLGLPATAAVGDAAPPDVDAFLSNPAYGERWGRHWLDVARWAESNGHQHNRQRPHAWRYRDWVVEAFNEHLPFDQFLRQQIAGDELEPYRDNQIVATGFLAAARYSGNELDKQIQRNDILVDIANTTAKAFLGLTLECAQCHTHKFDPISIRDYYRFTAFFAQGQPVNVVLRNDTPEMRAVVAERQRIFDTVHERMVLVKRKQGHPEPIYVLPKSVVNGMTPSERKRFDELEKKIHSQRQTWAFYSPATAGSDLSVAPHEMRWPLPYDPRRLESRQTHLLVRGDVKSPGPVVAPGWPRVFGQIDDFDPEKPRAELAEWMTSPDNPLTARVWVNRIWQWHFGRGLVETSGDFGTQGTPPSHPELLDYLASELIRHRWDTRHIHRLILNSATYRQASQFHAANSAIDPENKWLWRWSLRRLEAEAIRDSILAVAGMLDRRTGGPSDDVGSQRRSLYLRQRRGALPDQQTLFDGAGAVVSCSRRRVSTTALQPLWLLNSSLVQDAAVHFAARAGSVDEAVRLAYGRQPSDAERRVLTQLADVHGLESACVAILNSSEFLYIR